MKAQRSLLGAAPEQQALAARSRSSCVDRRYWTSSQPLRRVSATSKTVQRTAKRITDSESVGRHRAGENLFAVNQRHPLDNKRILTCETEANQDFKHQSEVGNILGVFTWLSKVKSDTAKTDLWVSMRWCLLCFTLRYKVTCLA
ncbi:hypothetical protein Pyn_03341 [Prunus yedoensis var. nudiflora]|uniref:Uncharacterized protein n=1 Tax=Prunus yedoensis var. nudiflora TaxID=2094558 RepID=A0A315AY14_PRUYE|nr:hypothetical protein Pyn_03341 [Prunus yedoensis var. nudiflora]